MKTNLIEWEREKEKKSLKTFPSDKICASVWQIAIEFYSVCH